MNFSKFDRAVDTDDINRRINYINSINTINYSENSRKFDTIPSGEYVVKFEKLTLGRTRDGREMVKAMMRIIGGEFDRKCIFFNRVIRGTKNDYNMLMSALNFLASLQPANVIIEFRSYVDFANVVNDVFFAIRENKYTICYNCDAFDSVTIMEGVSK